MSQKNSLDHASHNEKVCRYLDKKPDYGDWVITTAYYAALHFVEHKLFPITFQGKKCNTFAQYYSMLNTDNPKHRVLSDLVEDKLDDIGADFCWLRDTSWSARYHNYQYNRNISTNAKKLMGNIKRYCVKD